MPQTAYRFHIGDAVALDEAEMSLHLAMIALEGLYSPAAVRLEVRYDVDPDLKVIVVDGSTPVGNALVRVFTTLLSREFGDECFTVRRTCAGDAFAAFPLTATAGTELGTVEAPEGKVA